MLKLECTWCHENPEIYEWNENNKISVSLGLIENFIPEDLTIEDWEEYKIENSGRMDCPCCGEPSCLEDIEAY